VGKYECAVVVVPTADTSVLESTAQKYTDVITSNGGTFTKLDDWGKRNLAYEINDHTEGFYHFYKFEGGEKVVNELNRQLRFDENVLRHLIVHEDLKVHPLMTEEEAAALPPLRPSRSSRPRRGR
jgi:small subunit ribosomal protein S6